MLKINSFYNFLGGLVLLCLSSSAVIAQDVGDLVVLAGTGSENFTSASVKASESGLRKPNYLTVDDSGKVYFSELQIDYDNGVFTASTRLVDPVKDSLYLFGGDGSLTAEEGVVDGASPTSGELDISGLQYGVYSGVGRIYTVSAFSERLRDINNGISNDVISFIGSNSNDVTNLDIAYDGVQYLYVTLAESSKLVKFDLATSTKVATYGSIGYGGDGDNLTDGSLRFERPSGLAIDGSGNIYIADAGSHTVRMITSSGDISTIAGTNGSADTTGIGGLAIAAKLDTPKDIAVNTAGDSIFISDSGNHCVKLITGGKIYTVVGTNGVSGDAGYGGQADSDSIRLTTPFGLDLDTDGNLYIADYATSRILKVTYAATSSAPEEEVIPEWNGTAWTPNVPDSTYNTVITSSNAVGSFIAKNITINDGIALTFTENDTVTLYGDYINNGSGISGAGVVRFVADSAQEVMGAMSVNGILVVSDTSTLVTNNNIILQDSAVLFHDQGTITGDITAKRIGNTDTLAYNYWSLPVQNASEASNLGVRHMYTWNEPTGAWNVFGGTLISGQGVTATGSGTVSVSGTPYADSVSILVTDQGPTTPEDNSGFVLVGNPFLAPIDYTAFISSNPNIIDGALYFYEGNADGSGQYHTVNSGSMDTINTFQGFFLQVGGDDSVRFYHEHKLLAGNNGFYRSIGIEKELTLEVSTSKYKDKVKVLIDDAFSENSDYGYDATKLYGTQSLSIAITNQQDDYSMLAIQDHDEIVLPLHLTAVVGEMITFTPTIFKQDIDFTVSLRNKVSGESISFDEKETASFEFKEGDEFVYELVIQTQQEAILGIGEGNSTQLEILPQLSNLNIKYTGLKATSGTVEVSDILGKKVFEYQISLNGSGVIELPWTAKKSTVYIIKVMAGDHLETKKVLIK